MFFRRAHVVGHAVVGDAAGVRWPQARKLIYFKVAEGGGGELCF